MMINVKNPLRLGAIVGGAIAYYYFADGLTCFAFLFGAVVGSLSVELKPKQQQPTRKANPEDIPI